MSFFDACMYSPPSSEARRHHHHHHPHHQQSSSSLLLRHNSTNHPSHYQKCQHHNPTTPTYASNSFAQFPHSPTNTHEKILPSSGLCFRSTKPDLNTFSKFPLSDEDRQKLKNEINDLKSYIDHAKDFNSLNTKEAHSPCRPCFGNEKNVSPNFSSTWPSARGANAFQSSAALDGTKSPLRDKSQLLFDSRESPSESRPSRHSPPPPSSDGRDVSHHVASSAAAAGLSPWNSLSQRAFDSRFDRPLFDKASLPENLNYQQNERHPSQLSSSSQPQTGLSSHYQSDIQRISQLHASPYRQNIRNDDERHIINSSLPSSYQQNQQHEHNHYASKDTMSTPPPPPPAADHHHPHPQHQHQRFSSACDEPHKSVVMLPSSLRTIQAVPVSPPVQKAPFTPTSYFSSVFQVDPSQRLPSYSTSTDAYDGDFLFSTMSPNKEKAAKLSSPSPQKQVTFSSNMKANAFLPPSSSSSSSSFLQNYEDDANETHRVVGRSHYGPYPSLDAASDRFVFNSSASSSYSSSPFSSSLSASSSPAHQLRGDSSVFSPQNRNNLSGSGFKSPAKVPLETVYAPPPRATLNARERLSQQQQTPISNANLTPNFTPKSENFILRDNAEFQSPPSTTCASNHNQHRYWSALPSAGTSVSSPPPHAMYANPPRVDERAALLNAMRAHNGRQSSSSSATSNENCGQKTQSKR